jgi:hypothetical protein
MVGPVVYRLLAWKVDNVALVPPDRFRKRTSTCANQADSGTDNRSDEALAHWVLLQVADLICRLACAP